MTRPRALALASLGLLLGAPSLARAGSFDATGSWLPDPDAVTVSSFASTPLRYQSTSTNKSCGPAPFSVVTAEDALHGDGYLHMDTVRRCEETWPVSLPVGAGSYRASIWFRHGVLDARFVVTYATSSGLSAGTARLFPTGRATSDGWVELASNPLSVHEAPHAAYLVLSEYASVDGADLDAFEIVREGEPHPAASCSSLHDAACGDEGFCMYGQCVTGTPAVPRLPEGALKDGLIDSFAGRLRVFFGGRYSRQKYLPEALAILEEARHATTPWAYWNGFGRAVRALHDAHTYASAPIPDSPWTRRLNVCFMEGDADRSHESWPKDPVYLDLLVSHVGTNDTAGLRPGDRLVAVDGQHPLAWARTLQSIDWGTHQATDAGVYGELAEQLGGPAWAGGALIARFAKTLTVLRCDPATGTCADVPETLEVASLGYAGGDYDQACDNRPGYHLVAETTPDPANHYVYGTFFRGAIADTQPEEAIFGMVWDTLYGGGDPNGYVNKSILDANADWKKNARGVILDHRSGNGGTLDAAENVTKLVRDRFTIAVTRMPIRIAGDLGPETPEEGIAIFDGAKSTSGYVVGDAGFDPAIPVALITHRDVSASDFMPYGMKGAPNVRIFGPHGTAGAFSTFINFEYYGGLDFQLASGDTIAWDGSALIGAGVVPDEIVLPKQSDLLAGRDTLHEAALAWVRENLK